MRNPIPARRALSWAFAAVLTVAAPSPAAPPPPPGAANIAAARTELSAQLPASLSLSKANVDQTAAAVHAAVAKDPAKATAILIVAVEARMPKLGHAAMNCADLVKLTKAAITANLQVASQLIQTAQSMDPHCADALNAMINMLPPPPYSSPPLPPYPVPLPVPPVVEPAQPPLPGDELPPGGYTETYAEVPVPSVPDPVGFGPGYPGSPGFGGSAPSGGSALAPALPIALPTPKPPAVTSDKGG